MMDFEYREMLIENTRDTIAMGARYSELHADDRDEHRLLGECDFCHKEIFDGDKDCGYHERLGKRLCGHCNNEMNWS